MRKASKAWSTDHIWKVSDADWFYFPFFDPSCFFLRSEFIRVQFYFIFIFLIPSELVRVDPSWSGPTFVPACSFLHFYLPQQS